MSAAMAGICRLSHFAGTNIKRCLSLAGLQSYLGAIEAKRFSTVSSHYDTLEVTPRATPQQIKTAYYKLSKKYHPDVNKDTNAEVRFREIATAYEILSDQRQRRLYDRGIHDPSGSHRTSDSDFTYEDFLRNRGKFRHKKDPPTGRSPIYNFDEFYKRHYGEARERQYMNKQQQKNTDVNQDRKKAMLVSAAFYATMVVSIFSYMIWKDRKK